MNTKLEERENQRARKMERGDGVAGYFTAHLLPGRDPRLDQTRCDGDARGKIIGRKKYLLRNWWSSRKWFSLAVGVLRKDNTSRML